MSAIRPPEMGEARSDESPESSRAVGHQAARRKTLRVLVPYVVGSVLWIYFSDHLIGALGVSPEQMVNFSTVKGFGFVLVTGGLLWFVLYRVLHRLFATTEGLRRSEANYHDLYEHAPLMYLTEDLVTGKIVKCNKALALTTGFSKEEITAESTDLLYHPDFRREATRIREALLVKGETQEVELRVRCKNGRTLDVRSNIYVVRDEEGIVRQMRSIWRDITERKRAEQALQESNARWQFALEGAGDGLWDWNTHTDRVFYSAQWKAMLGFADAEIGNNLSEWEKRIHPDDKNHTLAEIQHHFSGETPVYTSEHRMRCKDGSYKWILDRGKVVEWTPEGKPLRMVGTHADITGRKKGEIAIRERLELEARLTKLADHIPGVIYTFRLRPDGTIHLPYASRTVQEIFGANAAELQTDAVAIFRAIHPADLPVVNHSIQESARTLTPWHAEFRINHPQKGEIWIEARSTPEREASGAILWHGFVHEVSGRKKTEIQIRQLSRAVEQSPVSIVITDLQGDIEYVNPKFTEVTGYTAAEALGQNPRILKSDHTCGQVYRELWTAITDGREWHGELLNKRKNGELFWEDASILPIRAPDGIITHFLAVKEDITAKRQAEQRIREQAALLDQTQDAVLVLNLERRIAYCNQSAARLYAPTARQILGEPGDALLFPEEPARCAEVCQETLKNGGWSGDIRVAGPGGQIRLFQSRWTLVHDLAGKRAAFLITSTDITERQRFEMQLLHGQRLESLGTLASGVAHDLNNILAPILMAVELLSPLALQAANGEVQDMLRMLSESAQRGADIVRQLLIFGRGFEGQHAELQPRILLKEIIRIINETFPKNLQLEFLCPAELWTVQGDPTQIHQMLLNLCVNARDAMPQGGTLTLAARNLTLDERTAAQNPEAHPGPYVLIEVSDTGCGIPPEILNRIFDPFFTTKAPGKGTGLGLSTVLGIAKSHHGFVRVQSRVGAGSQFKLYLPALNSPTQSKPPIPPPILPMGNLELILWVDDEAAVREIGKQLLEARGYRVVTASNGAEGIVRYAERRKDISVVITDLMMPIMDGPAMIHVLRQLTPDLRIITMSGMADYHDGCFAAEPSIKASLPKPFRADQLIAVLRQVLTTTLPTDFKHHD